MSKDFFIREDGKIGVIGKFGERYEGTGDDSDNFGGGYKIVPVLKDVNGEAVVVKEVVSTATGSVFYDDRFDYWGFNQNAFRSPSSSRKEFLDEGYRLWKYDPIGGIIVNLTSNFVMGRGLKIQYKDEVANEVLLKFWKKNKMSIKSKQLCDEGTAYGENFICLKVHKYNVIQNGKIVWRSGDVEFKTYDPKNIDGIEHAADDVNDVYNYFISYTGNDGSEQKEKIVDISKFNPLYDDKCILHIKFNAGTSDSFGLSDLVRVKEWLDNYQDFLRDGVIINKLYRSPCYDITIKDGGPDDIAQARARYSGWKIGSNPVHNDKEEWDILEFSGANVSSEDSRRALLLIIAAGVGFPEYMLADGSNANLASTTSQQLPATKKFEDRQDSYCCGYKIIFDFVLDMKLLFGVGKGRPIPDMDIDQDRVWVGEIIFPEISREEDSVVAEYTTKLVESGMMARSTAAIKNGLNYQEELGKMQNDALQLATAIADTKKKLTGMGLKPEIVDEIINMSFVRVTAEPTPPSDAKDNTNSGGGSAAA